jgi:hypothetical protein
VWDYRGPFHQRDLIRVASAVLGVALALGLAEPLVAQGKPIQLALFTPIQIVPEKEGGQFPIFPIVNWGK